MELSEMRMSLSCGGFQILAGNDGCAARCCSRRRLYDGCNPVWAATARAERQLLGQFASHDAWWGTTALHHRK